MQSPSVSYPSSTQAQVHFSGLGNDPLEPAIGGIVWDMNVVIDQSSPSAPTALVSYNHTCYPAHIIKVNGQRVYEYLPQYNNTAYLTACLLQLPGYGKRIGVSTTTQVPKQ